MPFLALFFSVAALAAPGPADPGWLALLHFEGSRSNVSPGPFFLSPEGHEDAVAEWEATLELFEKDPSAPCRYPARALYLGKKPGGKGELCERWQRFREAVSAEGAELVFASAYLSSPSSMYGHTLLKFPRKGKPELLDYTLNYGADTGGSGGLGYVWKGLTGGFPGRYATAPYYLKIKEYNFVENRDFWVYPLLLSSPELELLVAHAWELREIDFPYFFLRKNCAYYLLEFLEVARPGSKLTEGFPFWAVPMDTIRKLREKGWLGEPALRPSRYKGLAARKEGLSGEEISLVGRIADGRAGDAVIPSSRGAGLLDAAYELWRYRNEGKKSALGEEALLRLRAKYGPGKAPEISEPSPERGHLTSRIAAGGGTDRSHAFAELAYRGAFHDILGAPLGYEPRSELSMGDIRLRWQKEKLFLERFDLLRLRSLSPLERWFPRTAWSFRVGTGRAKEMPCAGWRCTAGGIGGGYGAAVELGPFLLFALAEGEMEVGGVFTPDYRLSFGPSGGIFFPLWRGGRMLLEGDLRFRLLGEKRQKRLARLGLNQDLGSFELRAEAEVNRGSREALLKLGRYF